MATNRNWQFWHDEIADMPTFDDAGRYWYDAETGLRYDSKTYYLPTPAKRPPKKHSQKTLDARNVAKFFGGRALSGTAKQVKWAEVIRAEKIQQLTESQALICCDPNGLMKNAGFWIDNRERSAKDIGEFAERYKQLIADYQTAKAAVNADHVAAIAAEYNALTALWGFK
ncbi:hypothetical protein BIY29_08605 [Brenneria alni]|uniref:Uncharacterized protein n=2 Tax=Brenneria alni TaxID=71656 RepID=A0A421DPS4_9GAMM|nr:hypothetical protein BIY29_08605 [Brenneria alni]